MAGATVRRSDVDAYCRLVDQLLSARLSRLAKQLNRHRADHPTEGRLRPIVASRNAGQRPTHLCRSRMAALRIAFVSTDRLLLDDCGRCPCAGRAPAKRSGDLIAGK